jgi:peptide chain release factor 1
MLDKLKAIHDRWKNIEKEMSKPEAMSNMEKFIQLSKDYKDLKPIVDAYHEYKDVSDNIISTKEVLAEEKDPDFREMAKEELNNLLQRKEEMDEEVRILLLPKDPEDDKNAVMEIRAGTGGDEASIFAGDLYRMYVHYAESKKWKVEVVDITEGTVGGYKEIILNVSGEGVFGTLKYESGVHRVQRVPQTETQGRVHTSAASVVVLPEADEFDVDIKPADVRKDYYCSSGPGGQSVNTTYSAVRLTHIPTGIVATCQDEESQHKNLASAMAVLRARIYEVEYQKHLDELSKKRKTMVSSGDRSAKIRTYNWPQGRVTDHRIGLTLYNLNNIINGDIQEIIDALQVAENAERLKAEFGEE